MLTLFINTSVKDAIVNSANIQSTSKVLVVLKIPSVFKNDLTKLCNFSLETETISANNFLGKITDEMTNIIEKI